MSRTVVVEAKTVDDAVEKVCKEYGVPKGALKHDVISYGASGIFGLVGFKKAKIKAYVPDKKDFPVDPGHQHTETMNTPDSVVVEEEKADTEEKQTGVMENKETEVSITPVTEADIEQASQIGERLLNEIISRITDETSIETSVKKGIITFTVNGGNAGMLIGKKGQTLEAIQFIVEKAINKQSDKRHRILVDIEGYMENKISRLEGMALKTAEKVKRTGRPLSVGQMNSQDRKIVHLALKGDSEVRTQSMGEGYYRKLVVFPKGFSRKKRKGPKNDALNRQ